LLEISDFSFEFLRW